MTEQFGVLPKTEGGDIMKKTKQKKFREMFCLLHIYKLL